MQAQNCVFLDFFVLPSGGEAATPLHPAAQRTTRAISVQPVSAVSAENSGFYTRQRRPALTKGRFTDRRRSRGYGAAQKNGWRRFRPGAQRLEPEQRRSVRGSPHTAASCLRNAASCTSDSADPRSTGQRSGQFFSQMGEGTHHTHSVTPRRRSSPIHTPERRLETYPPHGAIPVTPFLSCSYTLFRIYISSFNRNPHSTSINRLRIF